MKSRLIRLSYSCVFVILLSTSVLAQSSRTPFVDRANGIAPTAPGLPQGIARATTNLASPGANSIFSEALTYDTGEADANSVAVADVNGDGKLDLVVANQCGDIITCTDGSVSVLLGNGDGTFQPAVSYDSGGNHAYWVAVADVNGDGKPDIIVLNQFEGKSSSLGVLIGNGDGTFKAAVIYDAGGRMSNSVAIADVNGDGRPDLIVANECAEGNDVYCTSDGGTVSVLLGNGDGTFQAPQSYNSGGQGGNSIVVSDLNMDGKLDVLVVHGGNLSVLFGNGDGTFQPAYSFASGEDSTISVAVADVNGDGKPDLVVANQCPLGMPCLFDAAPSGSVSVLLGNGDGTFNLTQTYPAPVTGPVVTLDLNGDGKIDLVVGSACRGCGNSGVTVFLGNGDGTFQYLQNYSSGGYGAVSLALGDFNADGKPDIAIANVCTNGGDCSDGNVGVLFGNGDGTLRGALSYQVVGFELATSAAVANLNGDGKLDLVFADLYGPTGISGGADVFLGNGDGTFRSGQFYGFDGVLTNSVVVADINNDGKPDLVAANLCTSFSCTGLATVGVLLGNGDATFQSVKTYNSGGAGADAIAVGDFNGDGNADVVVANGNSDTISILLGNGDGTFQPAYSFPSGGYTPVSIAIADVNADGKLDVIVANYCADSSCQTNGVISVFLGDGRGGFSAPHEYSPEGNRTGPLAIADVNRDGKLDIVVESVCGPGPCALNGEDGIVEVLLGNGDGTFQTPLTTSVPPTFNGGGWQLTVADFNGDGELDVAAGLPGVLLLGNGDGTFQTPLNLGAYGPGSAVGDFNGDGKPDLAVGGGNVVILLNKVARSGTATSIIASSDPSNFGEAVNFTASVTPQGVKGTPTGAVTFTDGATILGSVSLANGIASLSTSSLAAGTHSIIASYGGDSNFSASSSAALTQTVNQVKSTTALTCTNCGAIANYANQPLTLVATISTQYGGSATGNVTFTSGSIVLGSGVLSGNSAAVTTTLPVGNDQIIAAYAGDGSVSGSSARSLEITVHKAIVAIMLTASASTVTLGQPVTFSASVSSASGSPPSDGNAISFNKSNGGGLGSGVLAGGIATFTTSSLPLGPTTLRAVYNADATFATSVSQYLAVTINKYPTTTSVTSNLNPSSYGQNVTFTASVNAGSGGTPGGTVTFMNGATRLGTKNLSGGPASLTTSLLAVGNQSITVSYNGDASRATSTSPPIAQVVGKAATAISLTSSHNPSTTGLTVTFTATVTSTMPGVPTGSVSFMSGANVVGTAELAGGKASISTTSLAAGSDTITASYGGSANYAESSSTLIQVVNY